MPWDGFAFVSVTFIRRFAGNDSPRSRGIIDTEAVPDTDIDLYLSLHLLLFGLVVRLVGEVIRIRLQEFLSPLQRDQYNIYADILPVSKRCANKSAPRAKIDDVHSTFSTRRFP